MFMNKYPHHKLDSVFNGAVIDKNQVLTTEL